VKRKSFIKKSLGFVGMAFVAPSVLTQNEAQACTVASSETAGPFPTLTPAKLVRTDITGTRTGITFDINITVYNVNGCNVVPGVVVDIWHCDKDGYYSQYGGTQMQKPDFTNQDFLRGRQVTDSQGRVAFKSIFPGWYTGRATHIHVHIYDANGNSLLISQIAFPEGTGSVVEQVNGATQYGYTKGMSGYTFNKSDNVFSDGTATEMSTITGDITKGFTLQWDAYCNAGSLGVDALTLQQFQIRQNYPNPCQMKTSIPLSLSTASIVTIDLLSPSGQSICNSDFGLLQQGEHTLLLDTSGLPDGKYIYCVKIHNSSGRFTQSKLLIVYQ